MLRLAARLPDALVGVTPDRLRALGLRPNERPQPPWQTLAAARVQEDGVERCTEDIVLALVERAVADPDGPRPGVAGQLFKQDLGQVSTAVDPVHDLQRTVLV